jgi:serine/threonine-protein kinase
MLAGRYRIFGLVGKGGMGEVYRADDLKLGQTVALKFLPVEVERDAERLARFLEEVRIARQITHPNVCRVYDVGEVEGHHFLSMEFVDGEDLSSLLRRIGRLPRDKAIQIARQLCAGLAAAHEQGILHRDLKPANVMIDGRGRARITDFGLARLAGEVRAADVGAGTPAYMAPEQISGKGVTVRSDLYALGLVLYELCTGQPAFKGTTPAELARQKSETTPTSPAQIVEGFDPAVERVILRCLERDAANRPASALQVAAALPGGDPLAAALAAGETPSPELVAEAGAIGGLTPAQAWTCLAALVVIMLGVVTISGRTQLSRLVPLPNSPEVLSDKARHILRTLGYADPAGDSDFGFDLELAYLDHVADGQTSHPGWAVLTSGPPYAISFWYKQSPRPLVPFDDIRGVPSIYVDPPLIDSGMVRLRLDPEGRLRQLEAVPPEQDTPTAPAGADAGASAATTRPGAATDWSPLLTQAGFDPAALKPVEPVWAPLVYADSRAAWEGAYPQAPGLPLRIEAAAYRGKPVALRIIAPWTRPSRMTVAARSVWQRGTEIAIVTILLSILAGGAFVARRNVRLGRGDRKGATRLATFVLVCAVLAWLFQAHHVSSQAELAGFFTVFGYNLLAAATTWTFYLALEPYLRRLWPELIVSWVRLLDGRFRDPLVGRDVFVGLLAAGGFSLVGRLLVIVPAWVGLAPLRPDQMGPPSFLELSTLRGLRHSLGILCGLQAASLLIPMGAMTLLLLCRLVLRKTWLAFVVFVILSSVPGSVTTLNPVLFLAFNALGTVLYLVLLFRYGLLTTVVAGIGSNLLAVFPMTLDAAAWYAASTAIALTPLAALAVYAFRTSLAGRPALGSAIALESAR